MLDLASSLHKQVCHLGQQMYLLSTVRSSDIWQIQTKISQEVPAKKWKAILYCHNNIFYKNPRKYFPVLIQFC